MLDLNAKTEIQGVTLFRDFDDPNVFHYMPGLPHIAMDQGTPQFSLMVFRKSGTTGSEQTGGFLTMTVSTDLGSRKARILSELKRDFGPDVRLTSVDFTEGTARLIGLDIGEGDTGEDGVSPEEPGPNGVRLIEKVQAEQTPMLSGDNRCFFSSRLTEDGAAFMLGVLQGAPDALPFGISYDLKYTGLLGIQDLVIEIDFDRAYSFSRRRFGLNAVVVAGEIDQVIEDLKTNESIKIIDTVRTLELSSPEAIEQRKTNIDNIVKELATGALFRPTLTVGETKVNETESFGSGASAGSVMNAVRVAGAVGGVTAGMEGAHRPELRAPNGDPAQAEGQNGGTTGGTDTDADNQANAVSNVNNQMGSPRATFVLRDMRQSERRTVRYELNRTAAQERSYPLVNGLTFMAPRQALARRINIIDLDHPFFKRFDLKIDAAAMDFEREGVTKLVVEIRYDKKDDGSHHIFESFAFSDPDRSVDITFFQNTDGDESFQYRVIAHFKPDFGVGDESLVVEGPWTDTEARHISAHSQMVARRIPVSVRLPRVLPPNLLEVRATVAYQNGDNTVDDREEVILTAQAPSRTVIVRYTGGDDKYSVSAEAVYDDGSKENLGTSVRPDPDSGAPDDVVELTIAKRPSLDFEIMLQDPLDELQSVIMDYEVFQDGSRVTADSIQITEPLTRNLISEPLPAEQPAPELKVRERRLFNSGGLEEIDWRVVTDTAIIAGTPAADVMSVAIQYVGPPMDAMGLAGMLVDLEYNDPGGDTDFSQSHSIFIANDEVKTWKVRLADRDAKSFQYRVTLFRDAGDDIVGEFITHDRTTLILRPNF